MDAGAHPVGMGSMPTQQPPPVAPSRSGVESALHLSETTRKYRRMMYIAFALLVFVEVGVFQEVSRPTGLVLMLCTSALVFAAVRSYQLTGVARRQEEIEEHEKSQVALYRDDETGLPNRQNLLETLGRDISRGVRHSEGLTLAVIQVSRLDDLRAAWGADVEPRVIAHVAGTLLRITRNGDFLARLDDDRFACILVGCTHEQAELFADRATLAVTNRPIESTGTMRVPLYADIEVRALQFDPAKHHGPLEFLNSAVGDVAQPRLKISVAERPIAPVRAKTVSNPVALPRAAADAQSLRKQLLGQDYNPNGKAADFALAYQSVRGKVRRAG